MQPNLTRVSFQDGISSLKRGTQFIKLIHSLFLPSNAGNFCISIQAGVILYSFPIAIRILLLHKSLQSVTSSRYAAPYSRSGFYNRLELTACLDKDSS